LLERDILYKPPIAPAERFKCPITSAISWENPTTIHSENALEVAKKLDDVRKPSEKMIINTTKSTTAKNTPRLPSRRRLLIVNPRCSVDFPFSIYPPKGSTKNI